MNYMKILEIDLPEELTNIFYLWCDITKYPKTEASFKDFIQDTLIHFEFGYIEIKEIYEHRNQMLSVKFNDNDWWIYSWDYDEEVATWVLSYNNYLKEIYENIK